MEQELIDALIPDLLRIVVEYAEPRVDQDWCDLVLQTYEYYFKDKNASFEDKQTWILQSFDYCWDYKCIHGTHPDGLRCLFLRAKRISYVQDIPDFAMHLEGHKPWSS